MTTLDAVQIDRAVGSVIASAAGDALGSQYEFGPALPDDRAVRFGRGHFGHAVGEWTDDTSMAIPILDAISAGQSLDDDATYAGILAAWRGWMRTARDVGSQTRGVLRRLGERPTVAEALSASRTEHESMFRSGGNGSLMRTGPVALAYLHRDPADLAAAAARIAKLTHWEDDNGDACALWCLAIRHAILTGELDIYSQLDVLPPEHRSRWRAVVDDAMAPGAHPRDFAAQNGWVVRAFQGALAAVAGAASLTDSLERAVRGGNDTDTVAAIAGSLAGALYGRGAVPVAWLDVLHGWPGRTGRELADVAAGVAMKVVL